MDYFFCFVFAVAIHVNPFNVQADSFLSIVELHHFNIDELYRLTFKCSLSELSE